MTASRGAPVGSGIVRDEQNMVCLLFLSLKLGLFRTFLMTRMTMIPRTSTIRIRSRRLKQHHSIRDTPVDLRVIRLRLKSLLLVILEDPVAIREDQAIRRRLKETIRLRVYLPDIRARILEDPLVIHLQLPPLWIHVEAPTTFATRAWRLRFRRGATTLEDLMWVHKRRRCRQRLATEAR